MLICGSVDMLLEGGRTVPSEIWLALDEDKEGEPRVAKRQNEYSLYDDMEKRR